MEKDKKDIDFVLITYALDDTEQAVYILKAVGNKVLVDKDTISVENLVFQIYNDPETANPVTDTPDFTIPPSGTFPPVLEYRIKGGTGPCEESRKGTWQRAPTQRQRLLCRARNDTLASLHATREQAVAA